MNKINEQEKYNQRHGNVELTGSYRRGGEKGNGRKGKDQSKNLYEWLMDKERGLTVGERGGLGEGGKREKIGDNYNRKNN